MSPGPLRYTLYVAAPAAFSHVTTMVLPLTTALLIFMSAGTAAGIVALLPVPSKPLLMVLPSAATPRTVYL